MTALPSIHVQSAIHAEGNSLIRKKLDAFQRVHLIRLTAPSSQGEGKIANGS